MQPQRESVLEGAWEGRLGLDMETPSWLSAPGSMSQWHPGPDLRRTKGQGAAGQRQAAFQPLTRRGLGLNPC